MKIKLQLIFFILQVLALKSSAQVKMTKDEILETWTIFQKEQNLESLFRINAELKTREIFDDLLKEGVDTLLIYSVSYPGYGILKPDSCSTIYLINSYFFWVHGGQNLTIKVNGLCESPRSITNERLKTFFVGNYPTISKEFFMGVFYDVVRDGTNFKISASQIDHEPNHSILLLLHDKLKYLSFTDSQIKDKKNLFYEYNHDLTAFKLFNMIKDQIQK